MLLGPRKVSPGRVCHTPQRGFHPLLYVQVSDEGPKQKVEFGCPSPYFSLLVVKQLTSATTESRLLVNESTYLPPESNLSDSFSLPNKSSCSSLLQLGACHRRQELAVTTTRSHAASTSSQTNKSTPPPQASLAAAGIDPSVTSARNRGHTAANKFTPYPTASLCHPRGPRYRVQSRQWGSRSWHPDTTQLRFALFDRKRKERQTRLDLLSPTKVIFQSHSILPKMGLQPMFLPHGAGRPSSAPEGNRWIWSGGEGDTEVILWIRLQLTALFGFCFRMEYWSLPKISWPF
jgi:hypothetical protein